VSGARARRVAVLLACAAGVAAARGAAAGTVVVARDDPAFATKPAAHTAPSPAAAGDACPGPDEIVRKLQARYDTTKAFRADFRQETIVRAVGQSEEALGTVAFKKPGKMRWDYRTPQAQLIVSDGKTLWIYQPADRQALKAPFKAAFVSTTPISFLTGVGKIGDDFTAEPDARGCADDRVYVRLVPKGTPDVGALALGVTRATFDIVEARVIDPIGNMTTLTFSNVERNVAIPDDEFHFELPPGVDVVGAPGAGAP
jgi:outer membrane lipoprotein-sorting protein